jgi:predicted nucleic acid-binding Zn ribbon protein
MGTELPENCPVCGVALDEGSTSAFCSDACEDLYRQDMDRQTELMVREIEIEKKRVIPPSFLYCR